MEQIEEFLQDNPAQTGVPAITSSSPKVIIIDPMNFTNFKYPFLCLFEVEAKKGNFLLFLHRNGQHWQTSVIHENLCVGFPNFKQSLHQQGLAFDPAHKPYQEHFCRVLDKVTYQVTKYLKQHGWKANTVSKAISIASTDGDVGLLDKDSICPSKEAVIA